MTNLQRRKDSTEKSTGTVIKAVAILSIVPTLFHLSRRIPLARRVQLEIKQKSDFEINTKSHNHPKKLCADYLVIE